MSINALPMPLHQAKYRLKQMRAAAKAAHKKANVPKPRFDLVPAGSRFYIRETRFYRLKDKPTRHSIHSEEVCKEVVMHGNELRRRIESVSRQAREPRILAG